MTSSQSQSTSKDDLSATSTRVIEHVIEQHAEEAAFLWLLRDGAVGAPNYNLKDLADLDERVEAHLDGLRIAGQSGWEVVEKSLEQKEPGEVFAAAVLAFESGDSDRMRKVLEVGSSGPELQRGQVSALGWIPFQKIEKQIKRFLLSENPVERLVAIRAYAVHRRDPGSALGEAVRDSDSRLRAGALKAAGELGRMDLLPTIRRCLLDTDETCRFFAAWSAARLGVRESAVTVLREIVDGGGPYAERALVMGMRCIDVPQGKAWQAELRGNPGQLRYAALGAGALGDPSLIPDLIVLMENEEVARVAGEAFSVITGVDLAFDDLDGDQPAGFEAGPSENAEDENVEMDPDEDLPWPVPGLVAEWWGKHQGGYQAGARYLRGKEMADESLKDALAKGNQRQRAAAAVEIGLRVPDVLLFEVRARGGIQ